MNTILARSVREVDATTAPALALHFAAKALRSLGLSRVLDEAWEAREWELIDSSPTVEGWFYEACCEADEFDWLAVTFGPRTVRVEFPDYAMQFANEACPTTNVVNSESWDFV